MTDDTLRFGPFTLDRRTLELRLHDQPVALEPLPARLLIRLAERRGGMVTRTELVELGWPGSLPSVAEQSLNTCMYQIRRAMAAAETPRVELETLRGRGYRLSVRDGPAIGSPPAGRPAGGRRLAWLASAAATLAIVVVIGISSALRPGPSLPEEARRILERARYLALETGDLPAARAVLDTGRTAFPGSARILAEWAELGVWLADYQSAARGAERALALEPRSATAHRTRAVLAMVRSDWVAAEAELGAALSIDPTDTRTHTTLAWLRLIQGRFEDADRLYRRALEIDPMSATLYQDAGLGYLLMGRYGEAERRCRDVLRFKPRSIPATDCLFDVMVLAGRTDEAARWGRRLLALYGATPPPDDVPAERAVALTQDWLLGRWATAVDRGRYPLGLALAYVAKGRLDEAVDALRSAAERPRPGLLTMAVDPRLAPLRRHPGFRDLEDRLRLPG